MIALTLTLAQMSFGPPPQLAVPKVITYAQAREFAGKEWFVLGVNCDPPVRPYPAKIGPFRVNDAPKSVRPGLYFCEPRDGQPTMRYDGPPPAPLTAEQWYWHLTPPGTLYCPPSG